MRISVRVKPKKQKQRVEERDGIYWVWLKSVPADDKANQELTEILAEHFGVAKADIQIIAGRTSRDKVVEVAR